MAPANNPCNHPATSPAQPASFLRSSSVSREKVSPIQSAPPDNPQIWPPSVFLYQRLCLAVSLLARQHIGISPGSYKCLPVQDVQNSQGQTAFALMVCPGETG